MYPNFLAMNYRNIGLTLVLVISIVGISYAQSELMLYQSGKSVPQAGALNPSFIPEGKVFVGLPGFSAYGFFDNDKLSFDDVIKSYNDDSVEFNEAALDDKLHHIHRQKINEEIQLFFLGLKIRKSYFTLGINQVSETRGNYSGDAAGWAIFGPDDDRYANTDIDLSDLALSGVAYNEIALGFATPVNERLTIGGRVRYLVGIASAEAETVSGKVHITTDSVFVHNSSTALNTAGIDFFDQDDLETKDYIDYAIHNKNSGFAIDLGATYKLNDRVTLSAALNDLGFINWKDYTRRYEINEVTYTFGEFDVEEYAEDNASSGGVVDSLESLYTPREITGRDFRTSLIAKGYIGAQYQLSKKQQVSATAYADFFEGRANPAIGVAYNIQLGKVFNLGAGIAYSNGRIDNIGLSTVIKLGPVQIFGVTDRLNGVVDPSRAVWANGRGGLNLVFGPAKPKKKKQNEPKEVPPDTTKQEVAVVDPVVPEPDTVAAETIEPVVVAPVPLEPTVKRGTHPDELPAGHYVIVGVFRSKDNAQRYSRLLKAEGYSNTCGYVSEKGAYYVHVYHDAYNVETARAVRNNFRGIDKFQFPNAWIMTIVE